MNTATLVYFCLFGGIVGALVAHVAFLTKRLGELRGRLMFLERDIERDDSKKAP